MRCFIKLIYYSILLKNQAEDIERVFQLLESIYSLRQVNQTLPIYLHVIGEFSPLLGYSISKHLDVSFVRFGNYEALIDHFAPGYGEVAKFYPLFHKYLSMADLERLQPQQVLYVDSDTVFFEDPESLFAACQTADLYAREEPFTLGSTLGYNPDYLDAEAYRQLQIQEGCAEINPFNTGVMLMNNGLWKRFTALARLFIAYGLRFSNWLAHHQPATNLKADILEMIGVWRQHPELAKHLPALPYPCSNQWIRDQLSFWMTLGRLSDFTQACFAPSQVLLASEELTFPKRYVKPVISHYFSGNTQAFFSALGRDVYR